VKARGLLGLDSGGEKDDLGVKEGREGSARPATSLPQFEEQQDVRQEGISEEVLVQVPQIEIEIFSSGECRLGTVESKPWTADGSWIITVTETQPIVAEIVCFAVTEFKSAKATKADLGSDVKDHVRTLLGHDTLSIGVPLLQLDEEPPDPGEAILQNKYYDKSVQNYPRAVVGFGPNQEMNNVQLYMYSLRACLTISEKIVFFSIDQRANILIGEALDFSISDNKSGTLGQLASHNKRRQVQWCLANIPGAVRLRHGFDSRERQGDMRTVMDLAVLQRALQVQYPNEILAEIIERL
jgi:hypothetical protein